MAGSSKQIDSRVLRLAADFHRGWEQRLGRYAKYNFDLSWPSISLLDLVLADTIGETDPSPYQREALLGAAAYIGVVCANCWLKVGSGYAVALELRERATPEIVLTAQHTNAKSSERVEVRLTSLVQQLVQSPPNPFPLYTGFKRPLPPRAFLFAMSSLGVAVGLSPQVTGDWQGRTPEGHYNHVAGTIIELSRTSAEYYRKAFPSEPHGADPMLYRGGLIFPALFDGEDHYALRGALTIMEYAAAKSLPESELQLLVMNLCYSPDEAISSAGFAVAAALVETDIPDRLRWFSESLDVRRAMLKPTISILRSQRGAGGTPLEMLRRGDNAGATAALKRESGLHLLQAFRPELLRPEQRKSLMVADGTLAEQLYWGNLVKAQEILQAIGFNPSSAPLLYQAAYLELTLGAAERAEALLRSSAGLAHQQDPNFQSGWFELEARVLLERRDLLGAQRALLQAIEAPYAAGETVANREPLLALRAETLLALDQAIEARTLLDALLTNGNWSVRAALDRVELDLTKQNEVDLLPDLELLVGRAPMLRRVMNVVLWYHAVARHDSPQAATLLQ